MTPAPATTEEEDPFQSEDYQRFVAEMAKHCRCTHGVCAGVLAGGFCDEIEEAEDFYRRELAPSEDDD